MILPSPLTRTGSVIIPHPPSMQDTRRIQSMQPSPSISSSLRDRDSDDRDQTGYKDGLYDSPVVPVDDKIDLDVVVDTGPLNPAPMNIIAEGLEHEQTSASSYLPDMTIPSSGSINDGGTEDTGPPFSVIASEGSEEYRDGHERHDETQSGGGGGVYLEPLRSAPSDVPEMHVSVPARDSAPSLERHGGIGSLVARKSSLFKTHSSNNLHDKRSSVPLPSAVITGVERTFVGTGAA
ncbi:hypothetical protein BDM02DRAFT_2526916 [Thelephora ganbajun]|uniref:Uncharacterized protein n=1 Tax=Thelephora ganbajun TaxID=370292 RepID=A0ACB6ZE09_THEGA|nr:hypothetical protein BDM02DRAFT_2526916 [Thelephora ganbajun]